MRLGYSDVAPTASGAFFMAKWQTTQALRGAGFQPAVLCCLARTQNRRLEAGATKSGPLTPEFFNDPA
jgi:hypothetical protein